MKTNCAHAPLALALAVSTPGAANAADVSFIGTRSNVNLINPPGTGRCAPLNTVNIAPGLLSSSGTSNFGNFASTQSHCIAGAPNAANPVRDLTDGMFSFAFETGDLLFGTYLGTATFASGVVTGMENFSVTGGTGRFLNATGLIASTGPLVFAPNPGGPGFVGIFNGNLTGTLSLAAVPEPTSWALMISGFGMIGFAMRNRRQSLAFS